MARIFWDSNLFIYLFEDEGARGEQVARLATAMSLRNDRLLTSSFTLGEVMAGPLAAGDVALARNYEARIAEVAHIIPFEANAAWHYAQLRADRTLRAPDAIQLACAATARTDLFITNDARLFHKRVAGVEFISSLDHAPL